MAKRTEKTTILIDGDVFAYRVAAAGEEAIEWADGRTTFNADLPEAIGKLDDLLGEFGERFAAGRTLVALSTDRCFRYDVLPSYKSNRRTVRKPILLRALKEHLTAKWDATIKPRLEADDVLGIWSTWPKLKGKKIIISLDKDMKTIPGWFWDTKSEDAVRISQHEADLWHLMQTLMGDATDGYKGCPGIGPKKAEAILNDPSGVNNLPFWWMRLVGAFTSKGLTEDDALVQARVARICRATDYDFDKREPILWTPPKGHA